MSDISDMPRPSAPLSEIDIVYNEALCAYLLWRVGKAFREEGGNDISLVLLFIALPMLLHEVTLRAIASTNKPSGLSKAASKIGESRDNLLAIHERSLRLRGLTLRSLSAGVRGGLFLINYRDAEVHSISDIKPPALPERLKSHTKAADLLGAWFARLPIEQIASLLRIDF